VIRCDCAEGVMVEELLICVLHCLCGKWRDETNNNNDKNERYEQKKEKKC
jgi:hypothetical protein